MKTVSIVVPQGVTALVEDLALLAQAAETSLELRQRLLGLSQLGVELVCLHSEGLAAPAADKVGVRFELADGLRCLAAAVRAGDFDAVAVEQVHGCPSRKMV